MNNNQIYNQYMYSYPHKKAYYDADENIIFKSLQDLKDDGVSIYIHIPFCSSKCGYCNLFSIPVKKESDIIEEYVKSVTNHIIQYGKIINKDNIKITSLVIGGGTPLILSIEQMETIFSTLEDNLPIDISKVNFVIETSPNETNIEKLKYLKDRGVNRISIGVQSFHTEELKSIFRNHSIEQCEKSLNMIREMNFDFFNIDLIYGIKNQTKESLTYSIEKATSYNPEEIFIYPLYVREDTGLYNKMEVNSEFVHKMYEYAVKELNARGYFQTSMRRFVKEYSNNSSSCGFEQSIAFGCGGRSYIGNVHFCEEYKTKSNECTSIIKKYINKKDYIKDLKYYILNEDEVKRRYVIKNLGYYRGIDILEYSNLFNNDILKDFPLINQFIESNFAVKEDNRIKLSAEGLGCSDGLLAMFISDEVKERTKRC